MHRAKQEGVPDFVLMDQITEDAMMQNIKVRYQVDQIYTYIGPVVVSMNPYKKVPIYDKSIIDEYRGAYMYERPPHIFALSNDVYRSLLQNQEDQCVIISGESGAGKTEASKILMQYISVVSKSSTEVARVKDQLLESNPVLEAFGNAKTLRNDNSSRFGKYMEIQFEKNGAPVGGRISNYLLEKSRVVNRAMDERSFHIFYQILTLPAAELGNLKLNADAKQYYYLKHSNCDKVASIDDSADFKHVTKALQVLGFAPADVASMWKVIAAILHVGNVNFNPDGNRVAIATPQVVETVASLMSCDSGTLKLALMFRSISTGVGKRGSTISIPLDAVQAVFTRDALAKGAYERLFNWLVNYINSKLASTKPGPKLVIGVLDIYGFEVLTTNSFEQFCINLCNEKLQQLFIELTLKQEQEEYVREGIQWEPVKYFNNKIICDLIEAKPVGMIALLDECCLIAESTDKTFLDKMNNSFGKHPHFQSFQTSREKTLDDTSFRLKHYAGDVTYKVTGFLDKNKDTLFIDLVNTMLTSTNPLVKSLFPPPDLNDKKRPVTAGVQFKSALQALMDKLLACQPHYIRCIKPNDEKRPGVLNDERVRHQVRYLGLLENVRVRRAGFVWRTPYERFVWRYKMTCPETWPRWKGDAKAGTLKILGFHKTSQDEYRLGKTKVFIRTPQTLFSFEEKREAMMPRVVTKMQAAYRGYICRAKWAQRKAAIKIQLYYRKYKFNKYFKLLHAAFANVKTDPTWGKNIAWPKHPPVLSGGVANLHKVHKNWRAYKMITALTPEQQAYMRLKVLAYTLFKGNKPWNPARKFEENYLELPSNPHKDKFVQQMQIMFSTFGDQAVMFSDYQNKINPVGKSQKRGLVITDKNIYKHDPKNYKVKKFGTPIIEVKDVSVSPKKDTFVVVHCNPPYRDFVLDVGIDGQEKVTEFVTILAHEYKKLRGETLPVNFQDTIYFNNSRNKEKPGLTCSITFEESRDPKQHGCTFKSGKPNCVVTYK